MRPPPPTQAGFVNAERGLIPYPLPQTANQKQRRTRSDMMPERVLSVCRLFVNLPNCGDKQSLRKFYEKIKHGWQESRLQMANYLLSDNNALPIHYGEGASCICFVTSTSTRSTSKKTVNTNFDEC